MNPKSSTAVNLRTTDPYWFFYALRRCWALDDTLREINRVQETPDEIKDREEARAMILGHGPNPELPQDLNSKLKCPNT